MWDVAISYFYKHGMLGCWDALFLDKPICEFESSSCNLLTSDQVLQEHSDALEGTILSEISGQILAQLSRESSIYNSFVVFWRCSDNPNKEPAPNSPSYYFRIFWTLPTKKKYLFSQGWSLGLPLDLPLGFPYDQLAQWHCSVHIEGEPQHVLAQGPLWLETARTYGRQPISADGWNGWTRTLKNTLTSLRKSLRTHSSSYTQGAWSKIEWWSDGFPGWFGGFHGHRGTPKSSI